MVLKASLSMRLCKHNIAHEYKQLQCRYQTKELGPLKGKSALLLIKIKQVRPNDVWTCVACSNFIYKQEAHGPHRSPEKTVHIIKQI